MAVQHSASGSIAEDLFIELFSETFGAEKAGYLGFPLIGVSTIWGNSS